MCECHVITVPVRCCRGALIPQLLKTCFIPKAKWMNFSVSFLCMSAYECICFMSPKDDGISQALSRAKQVGVVGVVAALRSAVKSTRGKTAQGLRRRLTRM